MCKNNKKLHCVSAEPKTLQVYSFIEAGGASDQLPMKRKKERKEWVIIRFFSIKKLQSMFGSA